MLMIRRVFETINKLAPLPGHFTRFGIYLLASFLLLLTTWIERKFGAPTLDQIFYHFQFGADGLMDADKALMYSFVKQCILAPIVLTIIALKAERVIASKSKCQLEGSNNAAENSRTKRCKRHVISLSRLVARAAPAVLLSVAILCLADQLSIEDYFASRFDQKEDYFSTNYVSSSQVQLKPKNPKNLILIYVESLEESYGNKSLFGTDLLASLKSLGGVSFGRYSEAPGTNWTIAGIVSSQCGLPLKSVTVYDGNDQGEILKSFLPNALCLGDVLEKLGYRNVFMGGASLSFAGKGRFLRNHGYREVFGKEEWIEEGMNPKEMSSWGLHDDDLLNLAKKKLRELQASKQPFNLTLLTVDTHHPKGFISKHCARNGAHTFEEIVKCTSDQVTEFVRFIEQEGYLSNTNVVILGDHLSMPNPVSYKLNMAPERNIFNSFISAQPPKKNRENALPFDLFPTILEFLGIEVPGNRLGLGFSAFYTSAEHPPPQRLKEMKGSLMNRSDAYLELWKREG